MQNESKLIQNKGSFVVKGVIEGKNNPANNNGYKEGVLENGKSKGAKYRSIKFKLKTSNDNIIPVELFGYEKEKVYFYNKDEKDKSKKTVAVDWAKRHLEPKNGYKLITPEYDLVEKIKNDLNDGDTVRIIGDFQFQKYEDKQGNKKKQTKYNIKQIHASEDTLFFDDEKFEEVNEFTQEAVINEVEVDNEAKKLYLHVYIIGYNANVSTTTFEVDMLKAHPAFIDTLKGMKFGDFLKFYGKIHCRSIVEETNGAFGLQIIKDFKKSLEVVGADGATYERAMYTEDDFLTIEKPEIINWGEVAKNTNAKTADGYEALPFDL
jgi:hypothetical protein